MEILYCVYQKQKINTDFHLIVTASPLGLPSLIFKLSNYHIFKLISTYNAFKNLLFFKIPEGGAWSSDR